MKEAKFSEKMLKEPQRVGCSSFTVLIRNDRYTSREAYTWRWSSGRWVDLGKGVEIIGAARLESGAVRSPRSLREVWPVWCIE